MKKYFLIAILFIISFTTFAQKAKGKATTSNSTITVLSNYSCPLHHDIVSNKPGKCSKCNMDMTLSKKEQMKKEVMKDYTCPMHREVVSNNAGRCSKCNTPFVVIDRKGSKQGHISYTCSMHSDVVGDKSGKCPKCGMDLIKAKTESTQ